MTLPRLRLVVIASLIVAAGCAQQPLRFRVSETIVRTATAASREALRAVPSWRLRSARRLGYQAVFLFCQRSFLEPASARHRQYEALRAYFIEQRPSHEVARAFGYSPGAFQVLCHHFRREPHPLFFVTPSAARASRRRSPPRAI